MSRLIKHASAEAPAWVDRMNDALEPIDVHVEQESTGCYDVSFYTDAGEDFHTSVRANSAEEFADAMCDECNNFNAEEHVTMWLEAKQNGTSGVPDVVTLVHDAEAIEELLEDIATRAQLEANAIAHEENDETEE